MGNGLRELLAAALLVSLIACSESAVCVYNAKEGCQFVDDNNIYPTAASCLVAFQESAFAPTFSVCVSVGITTGGICYVGYQDYACEDLINNSGVAIGTCSQAVTTQGAAVTSTTTDCIEFPDTNSTNTNTTSSRPPPSSLPKPPPRVTASPPPVATPSPTPRDAPITPNTRSPSPGVSPLPSPSPTPPTETNTTAAAAPPNRTGLIAGIAVGVAVVIAALMAAAFFFNRNRQLKANQAHTGDGYFDPSNPNNGIVYAVPIESQRGASGAAGAGYYSNGEHSITVVGAAGSGSGSPYPAGLSAASGSGTGGSSVPLAYSGPSGPVVNPMAQPHASMGAEPHYRI